MDVRVTFNFPKAGFASIGHGRAAPSRFTAEVDDPRCDYLLTLTLEVEREAAQCQAMEVRRRDGGPVVTATGLRNVRLKEYIAEATSAVAMEVRADGDGQGWTLYPARGTQEDGAIAVAMGERDRDLAEVARVYSEAVAAGRPPTKAVAGHFNISPATADRRVRAARAAKFDLPPAPKGGRPRRADQ